MSVEDKFLAFHRDNPHVYVLFARFAYELLKAGHKKISSKLIIERIRWETAVSTTGAGWSTTARKPFLIDNRFTPWYARKFVKDFPHLADRFELRSIRTP